MYARAGLAGAPAGYLDLMSTGAAARVEALIDLRRYDDAVAEGRRALATDPENGRLQCELARALLEADHAREGLAVAEAAVRLLPDYEYPHRLRACALRALGRDREAVEPAREAVKLAPEWPAAHTELAAALLASGRHDEARDAAERARALEPDSSDGHFWLGRVALEAGDTRAAEGHLDAALALEPQSSTVLNELGRVYDREGNWQRALRYYERAVRADPRDDVGRQNLVVRARLQLYGVLAAMVVMMALIAVAAFLVLGNAAGGFVLFLVIFGVKELFDHRAEVLGALTPTAREVTKLRR